MLLFDCELKRGKNLFVAHGQEDTFSFVTKDVIQLYKTNKAYMGEIIGDMEPE